MQRELRRALGALVFMGGVSLAVLTATSIYSSRAEALIRSEQVIASMRMEHEKSVLGLQLLNADGRVIGNCTAVLIRSDVVLTAGHCFDANLFPEIVSARVQATTDLKSVAPNDPEAREVSRWIFHPEYDSRGVVVEGVRRARYDHDLALAILERPMAAKFVPQPLADPDISILPQQRILVYGFGQSVDYDQPQDSVAASWNLTLQRGLVAMSFRTMNNRMISSSDSPSVLCQGDSGGPGFFRPRRPGAVPTVVTINSGSMGSIKKGTGQRLCNMGSVLQPVAPSRVWIDRVLRENGR